MGCESMFGYIKGKVMYLASNHIILECNDIGYQIYVANPYSFEEEKEFQVYLYNHVREDENLLYGFKTLEEKNLFLRLINVKGLGPKTALALFATGSVSGIIDAIDRENILYLTKFPKIGDKLARQMILDLKGKLSVGNVIKDNNSELIEVLESLGYKSADIKRVLPNVNNTLKLEEQIKEALRLMLK